MNFILEMSLRSSLVVACGLAALWVMRRQPAAFRYWIVAGTLALAAAQPVLHSVMPSLPLPVLSSPADEIDGPVITADSATPQLFAAAPRANAVDWRRVLTFVWIGGAIANVGAMILGIGWLLWLGSRATPAGEEWATHEAQIRSLLGLRTRTRVLLTAHPTLLVTWGLIAPVVLLPIGAAAWSPERIRLVLAHEMAHVVRRDWVMQLASEIVRSINWFNPLFWLACARLRRESEHACDDMVLKLGIGGTSYASHLVDMARTFSVHGRTWLPAPSIARPSTLERRVRAMLNPQANRRPVSKLRRLSLAMLMLAFAVPIAAAVRTQSASSGTVTDPSGRPLGDAVVRLASVNGEPAHETRTDANGQFQLPEVPAGDYLLSVRSPGFSTQRQRVRLSGGAVTFTLRLPVGTLRETVTVRGPDPAGDGPRFVETARADSAPTCAANDTGGQLTPPRKLRDVRPRYRSSWAGQALKGEVLLQATIGIDGKVRNLEVVSPSAPELEDEAMSAVSLWEFSPTYLNCQPVEVRMFVTVNFAAE